MNTNIKTNLFAISTLILGLCCCEIYGNENKVDSPIVKTERKVESLSLNQVTMKEAARLISIATNTPIVVTQAASKAQIDIHLATVNATNAIEAVCRSAGLWYQTDKNSGMIHVMTLDEFKNTLHFSRQERVEVIQILYPNAKDVGDALAKLYVNRVIWSDPQKTSGDRYTEVSRALKRMDLLSKRGTLEIIDHKESSTSESKASVNVAEMDKAKTEAQKYSIDEFDKLNTEVTRQLSNLTRRQQEVESSQIDQIANVPGAVFIAVLPENNSLMIRSTDDGTVEEMLKIISKLDKPNPQVLLEIKILSVKLDDSRERAVDFLFEGDNGNISGGFDNGSLSTSGGQDILLPNANMVPQGTGINSKAAIFNGITNNFKVRLQLLENDERVTNLASPNLIVSDNESSMLFVGSETTIMEKAQSTTTFTEVSSGVFMPVVTWAISAPRRKIGTSFLLTPKIHADRTVTLRLLQEQSTLGGQVQNVYSGGSQTEGSEEQYFISQDIDLQRLVTTVIGKDRDFLVIGGIVNESVSKTTEKIPGFSQIPYIGELLFTRMKAERVRKEFIIVIRPFVMLAPGESHQVSLDYLQRVSQHPSAREDLPSLGVNAPEELAKPKLVNPNDPWLDRMLDKINGWSVDDTTPFDVHEQINREKRRENHREALKELDKLTEDKKEI